MTGPDAKLAELRRRVQAGEYPAARTLAAELLAVAQSPASLRIAVLTLRARASERMHDLPAAIGDIESALTLSATGATPAECAKLRNELGLLRADAGDAPGALAAFAEATRLDPAYVRGFNNLAHVLRDLGRVQEAAQAYRRAVAIDPNYALGWANLGAVLRDAGDDGQARAALERALAVDAKQRQALLNLAGIEREASHLAAAAQLYARAANLDPRDAVAPLLLASTLAERDDAVEARAAYDIALARDPVLLRAALGRCLTLPMVAASVPAVTEARVAYVAGLTELEQTLPARASGRPPARILDELRWTNFLLAYQGEDDRALQARYAGVVAATLRQAGSPWQERLARGNPGSRIRVGFVSSFFRDGTVGRYFERWITALPRERFEVALYVLQSGSDDLTRRLTQRADVVRACPRWRPSQIAPVIRNDAPDVLVYPELGMDATSFALAALRLAPVQCAGWGHPVTTGHATIDVYFSSAAMEPPEGPDHYTERLALLPGIGTSYARPQVPADARREVFGLPQDGPLFLCPQSLFKIHPANDALFARVLEAAPDARLVLFEGRDPKLTAAFRARIDGALADDARARLHILPQCGHDDYLRINTLCAGMLDTLHWSGGNTSLDALACGLPIVTLPGWFMRGRQSAGMLRLLSVSELIAGSEDDYVRIAARLAGEPGWRNELSQAIVGGHRQLFDSAEPLAAFAVMLESLVRDA